jgi:hypothetical protein
MSAANPIGTLTATPQPVYRGGPSNPPPPNKFAIQSATATYSWGAEPGEATIIYDPAQVLPVTAGFYVTLEIAGHTFSGMCLADTPETSSGGARRVLKFQDNRYWLKKDQVYCAFNRLDDHIVNNIRVKRYVHYLPDLAHNVTLTPAPFQFYPGTTTPSIITQFANGPYFSGLIKTYTDSPLTSAQIIILILNSAYVRDTWTVSFQPDMFTNAVWDIDATGGKSLAALLQEISDQQGLLFTNTPTFNLVWIRKGFLDVRWPSPLPLLPAPELNPSTGEQQVLIDDLAQGLAISENPTNIMILGDRNVYMPLNIPMVPDWSLGWEQFWDINLFTEDIYQRGVTQGPLTISGQSYATGTPFKVIGSSPQDPEQILARQLALAYSEEITVAQYAQLRGEALFVDEPNFADYKKFAGKSRLDMPAALYITHILLKAFGFPDGFTLANWNGLSIPLSSLEIMDKMIARVTYDAISGEMTANASLAADGNGLALIQGYQIGQAFFEKLNPDRFNLAEWNSNAQSIWQPLQFEVDDSGEPGGQFILFGDPIVKTSNLVKLINGYGVLNARPTKADGVTAGFDYPSVQCTVCFRAEKYQWFETGAINAGATETYGVGGLNREVVFTYGTSQFQEVLYSDGLTADQKAQNFIAPLLLNQYTYYKGGYKHALMPDVKGNYPRAIGLTPIHDRITVELSPSGVSERVEYTTEYPRTVYTPERDLDRNVKLLTLLPGQDALRREAQIANLIAKGLQQLPKVQKTLALAFRGYIGSDEALYTTNNLMPGQNPGNVTLAAGTPLWSLPGTSNANGPRSNTTSVPPSATTPTAQHSVFAGVTTRDSETGGAGQQINVQRSGTIYVRVMGPVQVGAPVGQVTAQGTGIPDYLSPSASSNFVGTAQEAISTATVQLIRVETGSTVPTESTYPFQIQKVSETQVQINPQSALLDGLNITDSVDIFGLATPFTVQAGTLIYLEVLFDLNGNAIFANICANPQVRAIGSPPYGWRPDSASGFPSLVGTIDGTNLPQEQNWLQTQEDVWVAIGTDQGIKNAQIAGDALALFTPGNLPARYNQFYGYALIGFCSTSPGASGITLNGAGTGTAFTVVQCVESHLMLQGFCSGGVPSQVPVPYSGPFIQDLPTPTILGTPGAGEIVTIKMPAANSSATIFYSLDGAAYQQYSNPFTVMAKGTHIVKAYATQPGFFDSQTASAQFTV